MSTHLLTTLLSIIISDFTPSLLLLPAAAAAHRIRTVQYGEYSTVRNSTVEQYEVVTTGDH